MSLIVRSLYGYQRREPSKKRDKSGEPILGSTIIEMEHTTEVSLWRSPNDPSVEAKLTGNPCLQMSREVSFSLRLETKNEAFYRDDW
jgi:hypothetical protein